MNKPLYIKPTAEVVELPYTLSLLATLSAGGNISPLEEGDELKDNEWDDFIEG